MRKGMYALSVAIATFALATTAPGHASRRPSPAAPASNLSGLHDFDFLRGSWKAHHRRLKERLLGSTEWVEFDGTVNQRALMGGFGNSGDNVFKMPDGEYRGVSLRSYDSRTGEWAVWWLDGRDPSGELGPPIKGHFLNGVGRFYSKATETLRGIPILVQVTWTHPTPATARWEQAFSADGGKTWETNWITDFTRAS